MVNKPPCEHPNTADMANKAERDAAYLDEWRFAEARKVQNPDWTAVHNIDATFRDYRRLVREDARP